MFSDRIKLSHGSGGSDSQQLISELIQPSFKNILNDSATIEVNNRIAFTTDSFIIKPIFFPGGDIGKISICGTVNDLSVAGAVPKFLSAAVIIEEGFPVSDLTKIINSMSTVAENIGVKIVAGDTKVVAKGEADQIFITTTGIGEIIDNVNISPKNVKPGMKIIVSGFLGDHSATILANRYNLDTKIESDCAPLYSLTHDMLSVDKNIAMMRDITRGGLAECLNEIAIDANVGILVEENQIPVRDEVKAICEILGFDPLNLANEGKLVAFVSAESAESVLQVMRKNPLGTHSQIIGEVVNNSHGRVGLKTDIGSIRIIDFPPGNLVPRIC